jgi:hypothetical protein
LIPLSNQGTEAEAQDYDTVAAVLGGSSNEQTSGGWVRKTLTDSDLVTFPAPNDTNNRMEIAIPQVTWDTPTTGNDTVALLIAYDPDTTGGTDANIIPISSHDFVVIANSQDVILNAGDFMHSS